MLFGEEDQQRLAAALLAALVDSGAVQLKVDRERVGKRIAELIGQELERDKDLDLEAEKLLAVHLKNAPPGVDRQKLLQMIKRRLAEEGGAR
ncbi:hypothetical protein JCM30471_28320 [Desulfuromonas carbonis]|uniref:DUF507 family protein n=1 Tax=Desulfuromonas sp. DDH964 TaxID=1823759 RepID=UPI00078D9552|nr:DUF507 family protein [Desulfuromonas sp. DDH964]AMV71013.1 hypothetical protein DBW_0622 [Desulfuromonas sp. DDH964]